MELNSLISQTYLEEVEYEHSISQWGTAGLGNISAILNLANRINAKNILDYGSGCGNTANVLRENNFYVLEYEPGIVHKRKNLKLINSPEFKTDLIICTDVLEHIEKDRLFNVLEHLKSINCPYYFVTVCTRPAARILSNGDNAHLIVENIDWWSTQLKKFFKIEMHDNDAYILIK